MLLVLKRIVSLSKQNITYCVLTDYHNFMHKYFVNLDKWMLFTLCKTTYQVQPSEREVFGKGKVT